MKRIESGSLLLQTVESFFLNLIHTCLIYPDDKTFHFVNDFIVLIYEDLFRFARVRSPQLLLPSFFYVKKNPLL
ncbi:hypothetical protein HDE70_002564 [Pedobacter cryoconitis]|nr:hypothetical protein [Pedobacter cryoconitis]